jgi:hypothetical protein
VQRVRDILSDLGTGRALVVLAVVSACDASGVEIVVKPPIDGAMAPDEIRLFIGIPVEEEGGLGPDGFARGQTRYGDRWVRDPNNFDDVVAVSPGDA